MKKFISIFSLLVFVLSVSAEVKRFDQLGKYKNVEITSTINWRGIRIKHSGGSCYITDKDLNSDEKQILSKELKVWRKKSAKRNWRKNVQNRREIEEKEYLLSSFFEQIEKMSRAEIEDWTIKHVGVVFTSPDFQELLKEKFESVPSLSNVNLRITARIEALELAEIPPLMKELEKLSLPEVHRWCRFFFGAEYYSPDFKERFDKRFLFAASRKNLYEGIRLRLVITEMEAFREITDSIDRGSIALVNNRLYFYTGYRYGDPGFEVGVRRRFPSIKQTDIDSMMEKLEKK